MQIGVFYFRPCRVYFTHDEFALPMPGSLLWRSDFTTLPSHPSDHDCPKSCIVSFCVRSSLEHWVESTTKFLAKFAFLMVTISGCESSATQMTIVFVKVSYALGLLNFVIGEHQAWNCVLSPCGYPRRTGTHVFYTVIHRHCLRASCLLLLSNPTLRAGVDDDITQLFPRYIGHRYRTLSHKKCPTCYLPWHTPHPQ